MYFHVYTPRELVKAGPVRGVMGMLCCCCWKKPHALVTVHLEDAHGLKKQDITGAGQTSTLKSVLLHNIPTYCNCLSHDI